MIIVYKNVRACISYSASTKSYYGSVEEIDNCLITFQASSKSEIIELAHEVIDQFLGLGSFLLDLS